MIPKLHYVCQGSTPKEHLEHIQNACTSGIELVRLGFGTLLEKEKLELANRAREITAHFQTRLIISDDYKIAKTVKADGIHLEHLDSYATKASVQLYTWQIIGATTNTLQDCETLLEKQVDYISLGPFRNYGALKDTSEVLRVEGYTTIISTLQTDTPIIGFGGITIADVSAILATGIYGLAISDAITADFNAIRKFSELLSASSTDEIRHTFN